MTTLVSADSIRDELRTHLAAILYCEIEEIDDDATFAELGLDSVLGVELVSLLNTKYGLEEMLDTVYAHPTVNQLSTYVSSQAAALEATAN